MDYWRKKELEASAHAQCLQEIFEEFIECAVEDDPIDFYHRAYQACSAIVSVFEPIGMPEEGYRNAQILNLEAERAKRKHS